jgi:two-component system CheB/CheR fusion protein
MTEEQGSGPEPVDDPAGSPEDFEALLLFLKMHRAFDFTGYKRASLMRRVRKRMAEVGIDTYAEEMDNLLVHPDEFAHLFDTILIKVTSFYRDPDSWTYLERELLPSLLAAKREDEPLRAWCAGCASGEEAYTLLMVLGEVLGDEALKAGRNPVKIYATDVDEQALHTARHARYSERDLKGVEPRLVEKYFEPAGASHVFRSDLRRLVIFGRHDLVRDPPISRLDLIVCRNVLIYLNSDAQAGVLQGLHFGLRPAGCLFLGKAEMLLSRGSLFTPVNVQHRIFRSTPASLGSGLPRLLSTGGSPMDSPDPPLQDTLREAAFLAGPVPQLVIDRVGRLVSINEGAQRMFGVEPDDVGLLFRDLEVSYRPVELRSLIDEAYAKQEGVRRTGIVRTLADGRKQMLEVQVTPLPAGSGSPGGASVCFVDVTEHMLLENELAGANDKLQAAMETLQSTNEELETTNEELQSTNEELETTNEELQSTNEELETMNEELQATNEELETLNDELRVRSSDLDESNLFLEAILAGLDRGMIVLDSDLRVRVWNSAAERQWGLRASEVIQEPLLELDVGLPVSALGSVLLSVLTGAGETDKLTIDAINRLGRPVRCTVTCSPLCDAEGRRRGVIVAIEDVPGSPGDAPKG